MINQSINIICNYNVTIFHWNQILNTLFKSGGKYVHHYRLFVNSRNLYSFVFELFWGEIQEKWTIFIHAAKWTHVIRFNWFESHWYISYSCLFETYIVKKNVSLFAPLVWILRTIFLKRVLVRNSHFMWLICLCLIMS